MNADNESSSPPAPGAAEPTAAAHRAIRSFVVRAGRTTAAQQRALSELWPAYGIEYSAQPLDLNQVFDRVAPRMIEIGFGDGEALLQFAAAHPEFDCVGIEVHKPGIGHLLLRTQQRGLRNIRVICHDAVEVLTSQLPAASIEVAHIFFPDPWPKKRHHKRRLIQPPFVALLARVLALNGILRLATDWEPYALHMREVLDAASTFSNAAAQAGFATRAAQRPLTRFERRGQRLGHGVWDLEYLRKPING